MVLKKYILMFQSIKNLFNTITKAFNSVLTLGLKSLEFVLQAGLFIIDIGLFLLNSKFLKQNTVIIALFVCIGLGHNFIIINEEILVTFCFLAAIGFLYSNFGSLVNEALEERSEGIRKELTTFLLLKQENLNELYKSEESFLNTTQNLAILQNYCQEHFVHLDQNQQKALAGLVAQHLHSKVEALHVVKKSLQPTLHTQMNVSFREAVLEDFTAIDSSESISECLTQIEDL